MRRGRGGREACMEGRKAVLPSDRVVPSTPSSQRCSFSLERECDRASGFWMGVFPSVQCLWIVSERFSPSRDVSEYAVSHSLSGEKVLPKTTLRSLSLQITHLEYNTHCSAPCFLADTGPSMYIQLKTHSSPSSPKCLEYPGVRRRPWSGQNCISFPKRGYCARNISW